MMFRLLVLTALVCVVIGIPQGFGGHLGSCPLDGRLCPPDPKAPQGRLCQRDSDCHRNERCCKDFCHPLSTCKRTLTRPGRG
ncbi:waprin-Thr1-like [Procambarus clarkii]|uniref:waprin-Thr1-like n=1 Tax=Procambarus clarkii TaxID=6728 RepID=UPI0037435936